MRSGIPILAIFLAFGGGLGGQEQTEPIVSEAVAPKYPRLAWIAMISSTLVINVEIGASGQVVKAEALSGHPLFREASIEAARHWLFRPPGGPRKVALTFSFKIYSSEAERGGVVAIFKPPFGVEVRETPPPPMIN
jgi:TonB family protein